MIYQSVNNNLIKSKNSLNKVNNYHNKMAKSHKKIYKIKKWMEWKVMRILMANKILKVMMILKDNTIKMKTNYKMNNLVRINKDMDSNQKINKWIHKIWNKRNHRWDKEINNLKMYSTILEMNHNTQRRRNQLTNQTRIIKNKNKITKK